MARGLNRLRSDDVQLDFEIINQHKYFSYEEIIYLVRVLGRDDGGQHEPKGSGGYDYLEPRLYLD